MEAARSEKGRKQWVKRVTRTNHKCSKFEDRIMVSSIPCQPACTTPLGSLWPAYDTKFRPPLKKKDATTCMNIARLPSVKSSPPSDPPMLLMMMCGMFVVFASHEEKS